jgi:hypothetical protein
MCVWSLSNSAAAPGDLRKLQRCGFVVAGAVDVVVGCTTRSFRLEARGSPLRTDAPPLSSCEKALRCISFDLCLQTDLLPLS